MTKGPSWIVPQSRLVHEDGHIQNRFLGDFGKALWKRAKKKQVSQYPSQSTSQAIVVLVCLKVIELCVKWMFSFWGRFANAIRLISIWMALRCFLVSSIRIEKYFRNKTRLLLELEWSWSYRESRRLFQLCRARSDLSYNKALGLGDNIFVIASLFCWLLSDLVRCSILDQDWKDWRNYWRRKELLKAEVHWISAFSFFGGRCAIDPRIASNLLSFSGLSMREPEWTLCKMQTGEQTELQEMRDWRACVYYTAFAAWVWASRDQFFDKGREIYLSIKD